MHGEPSSLPIASNPTVEALVNQFKLNFSVAKKAMELEPALDFSKYWHAMILSV